MRFQETKHIKDILASMAIAPTFAGSDARTDRTGESPSRSADLRTRRPELSLDFSEKVRKS